MWTVVNEHEWNILKGRYPIEAFGQGNTAPSNFREITEKEFCESHYYIDYSVVAMEYSQIRRLQDGTELPKMVAVNMYINAFGHGWAMERRYHEGKVVYYKFELCVHEYETTKKARCYWEGKCKKCGMLHAVDSSD